MFGQTVDIPESKLSRYLFSSTRMAEIWLIVRIYVGWVWIEASWEKFHNAAWVGSQAGMAAKGFLTGALQKAGGAHPDVMAFYGSFIQHFALNHTVLFSYLITYGEMAVGIALILGIFTGIAAFFGTFLNMNFLLAGAISTNPVLILIQLFLILAWRTAGWIGLDRFVLPWLGVPWQPGKAFKK